MSGRAQEWALNEAPVETAEQKLALLRIAGTAGTDNVIGYIDLDDLTDYCRTSEASLRATLNELLTNRCIQKVEKRTDTDRVFDCELNMPPETRLWF